MRKIFFILGVVSLFGLNYASIRANILPAPEFPIVKEEKTITYLKSCRPGETFTVCNTESECSKYENNSKYKLYSAVYRYYVASKSELLSKTFCTAKDSHPHKAK